MKLSSDRVLGIVGLVLSALIIASAFFIRESFIQDPLGPRAFPIVIAVVIALACIAIILRPDEEPEWPQLSKMLEIGVAVVVLIAYAELLPVVGFIISTAIAASFLSWRLGTEPLKAAIAGVVISGGIYVVFRLILGLSLARGPLGF